MNILTLDPSLNYYGIAIVDTDTNKIIFYECLRTKPEGSQVSKSDTIRVSNIAIRLRSIILEHKIYSAVFEDPAGSQSSAANKALSLVKGVTIGVLVALNIPFKSLRAREVKKSLCNSPDASKDEIFEKVSLAFPEFGKELENKPKYLREACSDAVSIFLADSKI
jgi:Holliday junction resolvasome RuvABC endonuclease subunit